MSGSASASRPADARHPLGAAWRAGDPPHPGVAFRQEMSPRQVGHLRHIENLSLQPPGDWSHMGTKRPGQEDFGAFRFQLAFMAYALALAHVHRAPNAPGAFRDSFGRLIAKMLHPDVWLYWRNVSQGGHALNAHLRGVLKEEWDPVVRDNIMFSAYVHSMTLLYNVLFDDDRYARPGAINFEYVTSFWGDGAKRFAYDQDSLNDHLYWKMVESGYLGIACEPNCVFQICNQPAILGFRLHDILTGGDRATEVIAGYQAAWAEFGRVGANGHFNMLVMEDSRMLIPNGSRSAWVDGWTGALMNMWNRDFIRGHYPSQLADILVPGEDGAAAVTLSSPPEQDGVVLDYDVGDFGFVAAWASEMGDQATLDALTLHADRHMEPTWVKGGLHYPRNDGRHDAAGRLIRMEPITGNALLAYAALNVPDGLWTIFNRPWGRSHFAEPLITEVSDTVDVLKAVYAEEDAALVFVLSPRLDRGGGATLAIRNVFDRDRGAWTLIADGTPVARGHDRDVEWAQDASVVRCDARLVVKARLAGRTVYRLAWPHA